MRSNHHTYFLMRLAHNTYRTKDTFAFAMHLRAQGFNDLRVLNKWMFARLEKGEGICVIFRNGGVCVTSATPSELSLLLDGMAEQR